MEYSQFAHSPVATSSAMRLHHAERELIASRLEGLTAREIEVVLAVCEGGSNEDIAQRLSVSVATVRTHLTRAHSKLATSRKSDLVRLALGTLVTAYRMVLDDRQIEPKLNNRLTIKD